MILRGTAFALPVKDWFGCYKPYPKEAVVPESFTHPAKMGWDLCHKIFVRLEELGLERGSKILDPFAGIFTTGLIGGLRGHDVLGMELEPKFVDLANRNIAKNSYKFDGNVPHHPAIIQGDSRKDLLAAFGGEKFAAVVGSPAWVENIRRTEKTKSRIIGDNFNQLGRSPGQMANLPEGDFQAVISSPPYVKSVHGGNGIDQSKLTGNPAGKNTQANAEGYGQSEGQLEKFPEGDFAAVVSSPPYEESLQPETPEQAQRKSERIAKAKSIYDGRKLEKISPGKLGMGAGYGTRIEAETYWLACRDIYFNCFLLLRPGGFIALVVKDFVRKKKRVPLCDQTWQLLQAVGFEPVERNRAWLVEKRQAATFFEANYSVKKERKSFFRRLAEKNGSPPIDFEEILIMRKR